MEAVVGFIINSDWFLISFNHHPAHLAVYTFIVFASGCIFGFLIFKFADSIKYAKLKEEKRKLEDEKREVENDLQACKEAAEKMEQNSYYYYERLIEARANEEALSREVLDLKTQLLEIKHEESPIFGDEDSQSV